jgi:hypothetical protein
MDISDDSDGLSSDSDTEDMEESSLPLLEELAEEAELRELLELELSVYKGSRRMSAGEATSRKTPSSCTKGLAPATPIITLVVNRPGLQ